MTCGEPIKSVTPTGTEHGLTIYTILNDGYGAIEDDLSIFRDDPDTYGRIDPIPFHIDIIPVLWSKTSFPNDSAFPQHVRNQLHILGLQGTIPTQLADVTSFVQTYIAKKCQLGTVKRAYLQLRRLPCAVHGPPTTKFYRRFTKFNGYNCNNRTGAMDAEDIIPGEAKKSALYTILKQQNENRLREQGEPVWMLPCGLGIGPHGVSYMSQHDTLIDVNYEKQTDAGKTRKLSYINNVHEKSMYYTALGHTRYPPRPEAQSPPWLFPRELATQFADIYRQNAIAVVLTWAVVMIGFLRHVFLVSRITNSCEE